jgi:carboxyl-terminal processing protease
VRLQQIAPLLVIILVTAQTLAGQEEPATPPDLSAAEKLYGLSLIWQEANYNFAYFDQVPDLDWDSAYRGFIPQVLATGSTFEYYQTLKRFVALLQDGHSSVVAPRALWNVETYLWILTRNVQGRVLVANVGRELEEEVPVGSVIETVDGIPAAQHALEP